MRNPLADVIGAIDTRLKRLESTIGSATDAVLRFASFNEEVATVDYVYVYQKKMNTSFIIGSGIIGETKIGDRSDQEELLYAGDGT